MVTEASLCADLVESPEDVPRYQVLSDFLSERGDPRGELMSIQLKLEETPDDDVLRRRERALLDEHAASWVGSLDGEMLHFGVGQGPSPSQTRKYPHEDLAFQWARGFVSSVRIGPPLDEHAASEIDFPSTIRTLLARDVCRLLRYLVIGGFDYDDYPTSWEDCVAALAESAVPPTLTCLEIDRGGFWDISSTELGDLSVAYPKLGKLEDLRISLGQMDLGVMSLPSLRSLEIMTGGLTSENVKSITDASWPLLERLVLYIGETGNEYGCTVELDDLAPLFAGHGFEHVTHLGLANSSLADQIAAALVRSAILPRLQTLDLSQGALGDHGARVLIDNAAAFAHLSTLDLTHSYISPEVVAELIARLPHAVVADQQPSDEEYRYVAISE